MANAFNARDATNPYKHKHNIERYISINELADYVG